MYVVQFKQTSAKEIRPEEISEKTPSDVMVGAREKPSATRFTHLFQCSCASHAVLNHKVESEKFVTWHEWTEKFEFA